MTSAFSWLDHSESDRRKALDIVDLFREQGTRDELGIGTVRDALADSLFPGISTVQTRAKYLLFVPWIYKALEERKTKSADIESLARKHEIELIEPLLASQDVNGVIGRDARADLQRLPSSVYWTGLGVLGIRRFQGALYQYHRSLDGFYRGRGQLHAAAEDGIVELIKPQTNWHEGLPAAPDGFPKNATLGLAKAEAEYLRQQIMTHVPGTLFAFLVDQGEWWDSVDLPWEHPQVDACSPRVKAQLHHAELFSLIMSGVVLLYNLMLAEKRESGLAEETGQSEDRVSQYRDELAAWYEEIGNRRHELALWFDDRSGFWAHVHHFNQRIPLPTRHFIDAWFDLVLGVDGIEGLIDSRTARDLISDRERKLKGKLARLQNPRALEMWNGAAGTGRMSYRWAQAQTTLKDILRGLGKEPR
jgi:hypothetical protein